MKFGKQPSFKSFFRYLFYKDGDQHGKEACGSKQYQEKPYTVLGIKKLHGYRNDLFHLV